MVKITAVTIASVTIPANQTSANVTLNGRNAGTTLVYATDGGGTGYAGDTAVVQVQANIRFSTSGWSLNGGDQVAAQVLLSDPSPAGGTYVTYTYGTAGRAQVSPDPAFIPAGQLASNVVITALGSTNGSTTITPVATGVNGTASTMYVSAPVLTISAGASGQLGAGQYEPNWYVYAPQYTSVSVPLTFTSTDTNVVRVAPATGAIPGGSYYQYFTVSGVAVGFAKVIVSANGWTPDTLAMTISSPRLGVSGTTNLITTSPTASLTVYAEDASGNAHYRTSSLALTISSSDTSVVKIVDPTASIPAGQYYASGVRYQPGGLGGNLCWSWSSWDHDDTFADFSNYGRDVDLMFDALLTAVLVSLGVQSAFVLTNVWLARSVGVDTPLAPWFLAINLLFTCVAEEAFFRGFLLGGLASALAGQRYGTTLAVVVSTVLFGLAQIVFAFHFLLMRLRIGQPAGEPTLLETPGEGH